MSRGVFMSVVLLQLALGGVLVPFPREAVAQVGGSPVAERDLIAFPVFDHQAETVRSQLQRRDELAAVAALITSPPPALPALPPPTPPAEEDPATFAVPAPGPISSPFGPRWGRRHTGVDFDSPAGVPVLAAQGGVIRHAGWKNGYGNTVVVDHGDGMATLYAHQERLDVAAGERVERGQPLGTVGATGNVTGVNLHFEVLVGGVPRDPSAWL